MRNPRYRANTPHQRVTPLLFGIRALSSETLVEKPISFRQFRTIYLDVDYKITVYDNRLHTKHCTQTLIKLLPMVRIQSLEEFYEFRDIKLDLNRILNQE